GFVVDVDARGQPQVGDPDVVADGELRDVVLDRHRDVARHRLDRQREELLLEEATVAYADRLAGEVDGDLGGDGDVAPDADEVDVHEVAAGRVPLDLPREGEDALAVDLERDQGVGPALARQDVCQLPGRHRHRPGVGAEAVDHRGNEALAPQPPGRPPVRRAHRGWRPPTPRSRPAR